MRGVDKPVVTISRIKAELVRVFHHESDQGVPYLLGTHPAEKRSREVVGFGDIDLLARSQTVVGLGVHDRPGEGLEIEVKSCHLLGEDFEKIGVEGALRIDVMERFDRSAPHVAGPHPVGDVHGKTLVLRRGEPDRQALARVEGRGSCPVLFSKENPRFDLVAWEAVLVLVIVGEPHGAIGHSVDSQLAGAAHVLERALVTTDAIVDLALLFLVLGIELLSSGDVGLQFLLFRHLGLLGLAFRFKVREVGGKLVVLVLGPVTEGVVVALRTGDVGAEENLAHESHVIEFHPVVAEVIAHRRVVPDAPFGGHHLTHQFVPGRVGMDLLL